MDTSTYDELVVMSIEMEVLITSALVTHRRIQKRRHLLQPPIYDRLRAAEEPLEVSRTCALRVREMLEHGKLRAVADGSLQNGRYECRSGKVAHNKRSANEAINRIRRKGHGKMRSYVCEICGYYHLTHKQPE